MQSSSELLMLPSLAGISFFLLNPKANWADEISREGTQGNWAPRNAFSVKECGVVVELLTLPSLAVIRIFEYL